MSPTTISAGGRDVELSKPAKLLFPEDGITKSDLADYYARVAGAMVPHVRGRPLTMQRFPDGLGGQAFMQKQIGDHFPRWVHRVSVAKRDGEVTHAVADDAATLAYLANQACITLHVWPSRRDRLERPDRLIVDLDPARDDFATVRSAAHALGDLLEEIGLAAFTMTTGSRGLHVVSPLQRRADFDAVRALARDLASLLARREPDRYTVEQRKDKRGDRLFLDVNRNAYAQHAVAPYAVRALPGAPVATPLAWEELDGRAMHAQRFTLGSVPDRLSDRGDPWGAIDGQARALGAARRALDRLLHAEDAGR